MAIAAESLMAAPERGISELRRQRQRAAMRFLLPMIVALLVVAAWPLMRTIYFSFTNTTLSSLDGGEWVGLGNYLNWRTLSSGRVIYRGVLADPQWWNAVWNTVYFTVISVSLETVFGVVVALVLNAEFRGRALVRAAVLIPWAIPTIVSAKMWGWMLNDQFGIINDMALSLGLISQKIAWTANPDTAMAAVIMVDVWKTTPFVALLTLAALQTVPREVYEATRIDGINPIKVFFRVTLPLIRPAILVAVIFRTLDALRMFDLVYVLTPNSAATRTMSTLARENLIDFDKFGYGSAQSTLLFLIIAIFVVAYLKLGRLDLSGEARR